MGSWGRGRGSKASGNSDKTPKTGVSFVGLKLRIQKTWLDSNLLCPQLDFPSISSLPSTAVSLPYASCPPLPLLPLLLLLPTSPLTPLPPPFLACFFCANNRIARSRNVYWATKLYGLRRTLYYVLRLTFYGLRYYALTPCTRSIQPRLDSV